MRYRRVFFLILFSGVNGTLVLAQSSDAFPVGARSWGMANAVVAQSDRYALVNNIAGIATESEASVFSSYHSYYGFEGVNTLAFGAVMPLREELAAGFSVQRFGDKIYNELSFGLGLAHRINRISLGLKASYRQIAVNASSLSLSKKALVVEMGGIAQLSSTVFLGAHIYNLAQGSFSGEGSENLPTVIKTGLTYIPTKSLRLSTELVKNTDFPASIRAGLEYGVIPRLSFRTGIASQPYSNHFGLGFAGNSLAVDYAASSHPQLGWSHHVSLAYVWKKNEEEEKE
ncbi:hypothetical protein [Persicitalea jodogahamensis]|uniref:PorV/PorQ family protein n=1 Tax=Persicitalea jodogahamensis TaxID=402147 RepID=A0A8J3D6D1_9BACT|nr:hypothetical protein [Persicitalea jodogahamensis]GHB66903.1 hypothetical protein GCM10007390_20220 [Persicitalea jodogahamensis]